MESLFVGYLFGTRKSRLFCVIEILLETQLSTLCNRRIKVSYLDYATLKSSLVEQASELTACLTKMNDVVKVDARSDVE
jgi:hypothetical protein